MSLISVKNLALPFQNKVHTVTIIMVGVVFAIFRFTTGSLENRPYNQREIVHTQVAPAAEPAIKKEALNEALAAPVPAPKEKLVKIPQPKAAKNSPDLLTELAGKAPAPAVEPEDTGADEPAQSGGALGDVEKQLGLR